MTLIRFIHTSDVHLDTSFAASGFPSRLGDRKREAIRATFRGILEDAQSLPADFVLIAGDLFEHDRITRDTVEFLKQQFAKIAPIRIFIAPGNHDPYIAGSPYNTESWPDNVHIFRKEEFASVELDDLGLRVTGFGFNRSQLDAHPFATLPVLPSDRLNVVVAHGSDLGNVPEGKAKHGPLTIDEIAGKNVIYCALGHYHQQRPVPNPIDETLAWYCGIPEGRGWDEQGPRGYLVGEIADGAVNVQGRVRNQFPLQTLEIDCEGLSTREQILDAILDHRGRYFDPRTILRVRLTGTLDSTVELSLDDMSERLADKILHIQWENRTVPALDFDALAQESTLCGHYVRYMDEKLASASDEEREAIERARAYGIQALLGREVRLR